MVEIRNLTTAQVDGSFVKKIAEIVLKGEKLSKDTALSVAFIGPGRMRKLNRTYRKKNRVTDALSFPESKVAFEKFTIGPTEKVKGIGEMVICLREVKKNARKFRASLEGELARVLVHGILHLLGYDHEATEKAAEEMKRKEECYLEKSEIRNPKS